MLRASGRATGLFTSPHLCDVRERIRINGEMVSRELFQEHFWRCHDRLAAAATPEVGMPGYFRFITLLGLSIFLSQRLDVVVLEVGIGGRLDATNGGLGAGGGWCLVRVGVGWVGVGHSRPLIQSHLAAPDHAPHPPSPH